MIEYHTGIYDAPICLPYSLLFMFVIATCGPCYSFRKIRMAFLYRVATLRIRYKNTSGGEGKEEISKKLRWWAHRKYLIEPRFTTTLCLILIVVSLILNGIFAGSKF